MRRPSFVRRAAGFTLLEAVIVLLVIGTIVATGLPALQQMIHRSRLEGTARETGVLCQATRLEAIKRGAPVGLRLEPSTLRMYTWIDLDANGVFDEGERELTQKILPGYITFGAPAGQGNAIEGFSSDDTGYWITFNTDGSINASGEIRLTDSRNNFLQLAVGPVATANVELTKWNGSEWVLPGEDGKPWQWY